MLTKLMDISATVRLDSQESTVKLVSTPFKFECLINMTNHIFKLQAMELARANFPLLRCFAGFQCYAIQNILK